MFDLAELDPVYYFLAISFAAIFGATLGSFLNVCIWRLPREGLSLSSPSRSHCPACGAAIPWYDNIPMLSWLALGGRCRACRAPISVRYLIVEALTAMLFAVLAAKFLDPGDPRWPELLVLGALVSALVVASFIDIDLRILPDEITLGGMMLVPAVALLVPELHTRPADGTIWRLLAVTGDGLAAADLVPGFLREPEPAALVGAVLAAAGATAGLHGFRLYWRLTHPGEPKPLRDGALASVLAGTVVPVAWAVAVRPEWALHPRVISLASALAGMAAGSALVLSVGIAGRVLFRKEAMGFGDVKLMGLLGGFAGWIGVLVGFALACLLGSMVGVARLAITRSRYLWFGPFLSLGCLLVILFPAALRRAFEWYLGLFR